MSIPEEFIEFAAYVHAKIEFDTYVDYDENGRVILYSKE